MVRQRTQLINGLRGMVAEFGVYIARGLARVIGFAEDILAGEILDLPDIANEVIHNLCEHLMALHARVAHGEEINETLYVTLKQPVHPITTERDREKFCCCSIDRPDVLAP